MENKESAYFDGKVASIDVVSEEEVASVGGMTSDFEELHEVKLGKARKKE